MRRFESVIDWFFPDRMKMNTLPCLFPSVAPSSGCPYRSSSSSSSSSSWSGFSFPVALNHLKRSFETGDVTAMASTRARCAGTKKCRASTARRREGMYIHIYIYILRSIRVRHVCSLALPQSFSHTNGPDRVLLLMIVSIVSYILRSIRVRHVCSLALPQSFSHTNGPDRVLLLMIVSR